MICTSFVCYFPEQSLSLNTMRVQVREILSSGYAISSSTGKQLYEFLDSVEFLDDLTVSFEGIELLTTIFLNESIGKLALKFPHKINQVRFIYPEDNFIFKAKVEDVIENALLGDQYDALVDAVSNY